MSTDNSCTTLERIFREVFENDDFTFSPKLRREDFKSWDSLGHIRLVSATEDAFGIRLSIDEIGRIASVADLALVVSEHQT